MSSDWPVCPISETTAPHRLGAALTYARRYALFTLVGIAGEDDLDAPDLPAANAHSLSKNGPVDADKGFEGSHEPPPAQPSSALQKRGRPERRITPTLSSNGSDELRERLLSELEKLGNSDALGLWAQRALPLKNQLSAEDAQVVEDAFTTRLAQLGEGEPDALGSETHECDSHSLLTDAGRRTFTVIGKPVRERDRYHLKFVASQPCLVCGQIPSDAHHIKFAEQRAMGRKVSDRFTVPICRLHHRELHRRGNERLWWENQGIDPLSAAAILWGKTHTDAPAETTTLRDLAPDRKLNGQRSDNVSGTVSWVQNRETKPNPRREAE